MTKEDYVIICGDFGGIWDRGSSGKGELNWLNWLESKPFTTLFVDGNHENFDRLYAYPVEEWNGGKVHKIRESILHLMRGQVFEIDGKKIFTFGGAQSHDIKDGILEPDDPQYKAKRKRLDRDWKQYRINHISWWELELPTDEELEEGRENLEKNGNAVDFIVSHCCASDIQALFGTGLFVPDKLTNYFLELREKVTYQKWFFGHYHDNRMVTAEDFMLYEQIIQIS